MGLSHIATRALIAYAYLLILTRLGGKRVVSEAAPFDFLVSLVIAEFIDDAIWAEVPIAKFAGAVGSIFVFDMVVKLASYRSARLHNFLCGTPAIVVRNGVADRGALRSEQLNEADLKHLVRLRRIDKREEIRLGAIELDHEISVLREPWAEPAQREDADRVRRMMK